MPWEVHRVGVGAGVRQRDANAVSFGGAEAGAGGAAVKGPSRKEGAGRDLNLFVDGGDLELADVRPVCLSRSLRCRTP